MTYRFDTYAPCWARGIVEDLEAGISGPEAVANAAASLRRQADEAAERARRCEVKANTLHLLGDMFIGSDSVVAQNRRDAAEHRRRESDLRTTAANVATLKGEFIPIARLLR